MKSKKKVETKCLRSILTNIIKNHNSTFTISMQEILDRVYAVDPKLIQWRRYGKYAINKNRIPKKVLKANGEVNQTYVDNMSMYSYLRYYFRRGILEKIAPGLWRIQTFNLKNNL